MSLIESSDVDSIIEMLKECPNIGEVYKIIVKYYPDLIVFKAKEYSKYYNHLNYNWNFVCKKIKCEPREILIINRIPENDKDKLLKAFCDLITMAGFSVRSKDDYMLCSKCLRALPTNKMYDEIKKNKISVPESWNNVCSSC